MAKINTNFTKLPGGYLFPEIGRRVRAFEHPPMPLIRLGIGDVHASAGPRRHRGHAPRHRRDGPPGDLPRLL